MLSASSKSKIEAMIEDVQNSSVLPLFCVLQFLFLFCSLVLRQFRRHKPTALEGGVGRQKASQVPMKPDNRKRNSGGLRPG